VGKSIILEARTDAAQLEQLKLQLDQVRNGQARVVSRAVNHVIPGVFREMIAAVRERSTLKAGVIRKAGGYGKATVSQPWAKTWLAGYPIPVSYFKITPRSNFPYTKRGWYQRPKSGVTALIYKDRAPLLLHDTFVVDRGKAWPGSGGSPFEVAERVGPFRHPIRIVHGPTPGEILAGDEQRVEGLVKRARARLLERANHETRFMLRQTGLYGVRTVEAGQ
jgi:hypothetical protein